ncbi:MAG: FAD-dependent oxidoreductase [Acidimicrobiales bacterium]
MGARTRVVVAGMGDTGLLVAIHLARHVDVVGVSTKPALVSGQELGNRLARPEEWRRNFLVPFDRFRSLDHVRTIHGRIAAVDLERRTVRVDRADGGVQLVPYDALVVATGTSNGFWRDDAVRDLAEVDAALAEVAGQVAEASTIAVVGGGPTGVSAAANLARRHPDKAVHLFHGGDQPLPGYHPRTRARIVRELDAAGVHRHGGHRAVLPGADGPGGGDVPTRPTSGPVAWSTGQPPFDADLVIWAVGQVRPHTGFLPPELLDQDGFVRVDEHLRSPVAPDVWAVGDVAATDPARSSARNWGFLLLVRNLRAALAGRPGAMRPFRAPEHRWGSILGAQDDGMLVFQPNGASFRVPRWAVQPLLFDLYLRLALYRGIRRSGRMDP